MERYTGEFACLIRYRLLARRARARFSLTERDIKYSITPLVDVGALSKGRAFTRSAMTSAPSSPLKSYGREFLFEITRTRSICEQKRHWMLNH